MVRIHAFLVHSETLTKLTRIPSALKVLLLDCKNDRHAKHMVNASA